MPLFWLNNSFPLQLAVVPLRLTPYALGLRLSMGRCRWRAYTSVASEAARRRGAGRDDYSGHADR